MRCPNINCEAGGVPTCLTRSHYIDRAAQDGQDKPPRSVVMVTSSWWECWSCKTRWRTVKRTTCLDVTVPEEP
jgi:hypothetical protein